MNLKGKKLLICCLSMLLSTTGIKAQANSSEASMKMDITLSKAIEIALAENPTIKVADKEIELKKIADQEAWQTLLPEVSVNGSLQHTILAAEMKLNNQSFKMGKDGTNTVAGVATLNMPIFAPAVYKTMSLTKTDIKLAQEKARSSRLDLVNQVTKAFYQMLLAQDSYEVMQQSYKISKENYDIVNAKYKQGAVSEYDKISAEVQMRGMSSSLVSTETALSLAQLQLKVLMGITADVKLNINDKLENYEQNLILANIGNDEASLENNSAVRQIELNRELLEKNRNILKTGFMPTIGFQLSGQYQSLYNNNFNLFDYKWSPSASFTLSVSVPIFKASNFTKLRSNKLQLSTLDDTRTYTIRQLNMAMDSYAKNMASSIAQVNSNKQAVEQANKAVSIASKRYEIGGGTILELNQSEVALTQAKLTYNQSIYDYLTNKADLDYTLGRENNIK